MTKMKNQRWSDSCKEVKVKVGAQDVCIKAANSLFAHLLIVARSSCEEVDLKEAIGTHEFSMINQMLMSVDGGYMLVKININFYMLWKDSHRIGN